MRGAARPGRARLGMTLEPLLGLHCSISRRARPGLAGLRPHMGRQHGERERRRPKNLLEIGQVFQLLLWRSRESKRESERPRGRRMSARNDVAAPDSSRFSLRISHVLKDASIYSTLCVFIFEPSHFWCGGGGCQRVTTWPRRTRCASPAP